jgi:Tol biopolymer transport system component
MAPEQASADPHLDHRVDIYAVGAVAYELLTGRPVFMGTTPQMILSAHVTEAPQPVTKHRETVPAALEAVVMRCLEKKPADRWQSADELLSQLETLLTPSGGITPTATAPLAAVPARRRVVSVGAVGAAVALVAILVLVSQLVGSKPLSITISNIAPVTSDPGVEFQPAISPDGGEVAFVAGPIGAPHLVIRSTANVAGGGEIRLADSSTGSDMFPSWSTDGDFVRFRACRADGCVWSETGKLGGAVRAVMLPMGATAPAWSPDGTRVAFVIEDTVFTSSTSEPAVHRVAEIPTDYQFAHSLTWSPDGKRIALVVGNSVWQWSGNVSPSAIWTVDAAGGEPRLVVSALCLNVSPAWLDASHLLFVSNRDGPRAVYIVEVGPKGARGEPQIVPGVADPHSISYSVAASKLAYAKLTLRQNVRSYPLGLPAPISVRDGRPVTTGNQVIEAHEVSPDGKWLAYDGNVRGNMDLYKLPLEGGGAVPLTDTPVDEFDPRWSPDGREIALTRLAPGSGGEGRAEVAVLPAAGGAVVVARSLLNAAFPVWSPSGREIALTSLTGLAEAWLVSRDSVGGPWHEAVQLTDFGCYPRDWAPDGSGVLCGSPLRSELLLVSPAGVVLWRYDVATGNHLHWDDPIDADVRYSRDGSTVYFAAEHEDGRSGVWAMPAFGGEARMVIAFDDPAVTVRGFLSVGPDRLYLTVSEYESDIWVMDLEW